MCTLRFLTNFRTQLSYSTSPFPPNLRHVFSKKPSTSAAVVKPIESEEKENESVQNAKQTTATKARTMAGLINTRPWSPRLEDSLSTLPPLSQTTFFQILRRIKNPSQALHFFNWAKESGFTNNHHSYFMMLEILGRSRNLNRARNFLFSIPTKSNNTVPLIDKFFNSLIRSYGDAGLLQESMKVFKDMKSMGVLPSAVTFNSLFLILFRRGKTGMVFELYDEMITTYGVKLDLYTFNILIKGFCMNSKVDDAFRMFKDMEKFDCKPDLITYNTIVDGLCRAGKVNIAHNVVNGMFKKSENLRPNVVTYTTLIRGYCEKQETDEALDLFKEMVRGKIKPNKITFNTIIKGLCESQKLDEIKEILRDYGGEDGEFVPDSCTFNTLINVHCSRGNLDEAFKIYVKMKELNVIRDSATYSVLIRTLCQKGDFEKAEELLDELFEEEILLWEDSCTALTAAYNPIFEHLCTSGKTRKAEKVFRQLMRRGIQDPVAYETLIFGHCKEGTFKDAHKLLILMLRRAFRPNIKIYESLIEGLLQKTEPVLAHDTLLRMLRSSYLPRTSTLHRVLMGLIEKSCAYESEKLMTVMLDKEIRPNINLSTDVVQLLYRSSMENQAIQLVKRIYENGYTVNMKEVVSSVYEARRVSEASELLVFTLKNDQDVDIDVCSTVVTSLCEAGKVMEAFNLYYELLEKGIQLGFSCLEDLKNGLEGEGKLKEAEFLAKRILD